MLPPPPFDVVHAEVFPIAANRIATAAGGVGPNRRIFNKLGNMAAPPVASSPSVFNRLTRAADWINASEVGSDLTGTSLPSAGAARRRQELSLHLVQSHSPAWIPLGGWKQDQFLPNPSMLYSGSHVFAACVRACLLLGAGHWMMLLICYICYIIL